METRHLLTGPAVWRWAAVAALVVVAVGFRLVKDDLGTPANLELVTVVTFCAMTLVRSRWAVAVPLVIVMASDLSLGNTAILAFTWTGWLAIGAAALVLRRPMTGWRRYAGAVGFGIGSTLWFYLWTNFGVWLLGRDVFYPAGPDGLLASYVAGLPFLRPMLIGNLVLLPMAAACFAAVERWRHRTVVELAVSSG